MLQERRRRRAKTPKQWILRILGELSITAGLVLLLFIGWQLYWTNFEADKSQQQAVSMLAEQFKAAIDQPADNTEQSGGQAGEIEQPADGQAFAIVYIPRLGENYQRPVAEGTASKVLDSLGLGHYTGSALPGQLGNFALAGHRQTNGAVLDHIDSIQLGDRVYVQTSAGYFTYSVYETKIVRPTDVEVIAPDPANPTGPAQERILTLTTCHPRFGDTERYIVHARMESWQPLQAGAPKEIAASAA